MICQTRDLCREFEVSDKIGKLKMPGSVHFLKACRGFILPYFLTKV